jgi:superfamily I DNA/RNA helicase
MRQPKNWQPRAAEGLVARVMYEHAVDISSGTWLLLARNHQTLSRFENLVKSLGYPYIKEGVHSTDNPTSKAIVLWERWRKGQPLERKDVKAISKLLPALQDWAPAGMSYLKDAPLPSGFAELSWMDALQIQPRKREYIRACLANGESLFGKPRITISTIHRAKGGEAEHVVLIPDLTAQPWAQMHTDSELRVLYVALTRAKESLTIIQPQSPRFYNI